MNPLPGARLTVINPGPTAPYTGMLPGYVAGHYGRDDLEIDLVRLCRHAGARLILGHATGFDRAARLIEVEGRGPIGYDVASIDIGITAQMGIAGFGEHAVGAKPLDVYARAWRSFLARAQEGAAPPRIAVIGGGVAGCELAMAMAHALREKGHVPQVTVIETGPQISGVNDRARGRLMSAMAGLGVALRTDASVTQVGAKAVQIAGQEAVAFDLCVGAAGAFAHDWLAQTDLPLIDGFIEVAPDLGVKGDPHLFAVGDCAAMPFAPRPKAGVFAVRAAPVLHHNLRSALGQGKRRVFRPQKSYLKLISLGQKSAMADKFGFAPAGPLLWRWKDRIDRAFMDRLSDLPVMSQPVPAQAATGVSEIMAQKPMCGGCGAKVSGGVLAGALNRVVAGHPDVVTGTGDDAAILRQPGGGFQVISTDHLRAMVLDPVQMTRIAAVHALGDVFAMGADPQAALAQAILPQMSPELQARTLAEITQTAEAAFGEVGAQLVGGHTTLGAELTLGFSVTGTREAMPLTLAGAKAGDVLVLTRPIGSGVIMAGHMAGMAPGPVVVNALTQMQQMQTVEGKALSQAHAMTDVTGFGLAGHVQALCRAANLKAQIWWDQVPLYDGAEDLVAAGLASSLYAANAADAPTIGRAAPLLHDPQTAGGLLAALPRAAAEAAVSMLNAQGRTAVIIGELQAGEGPIEIL
jgi:selenide,water dikinase